MPKRPTSVPDKRLADFRQALATGTTPLETLRPALADPNYRLVALAAHHAGDQLIYALEAGPDRRLPTTRGLASHPGPAVYRQGRHRPRPGGLGLRRRGDFFLAGIRLRQLEPVWGGSQDTAVDCRVTCATGLAATTYARALPELTLLLADPEPRVRAGVMDAIACCEPIAAEAVLRTQAQAGDAEPEVTGACLLALLRLEADACMPFVGTLSRPGRPDPARAGGPGTRRIPTPCRARAVTGMLGRRTVQGCDRIGPAQGSSAPPQRSGLRLAVGTGDRRRASDQRAGGSGIGRLSRQPTVARSTPRDHRSARGRGSVGTAEPRFGRKPPDSPDYQGVASAVIRSVGGLASHRCLPPRQ